MTRETLAVNAIGALLEVVKQMQPYLTVPASAVGDALAAAEKAMGELRELAGLCLLCGRLLTVSGKCGNPDCLDGPPRAPGGSIFDDDSDLMQRYDGGPPDVGPHAGAVIREEL